MSQTPSSSSDPTRPDDVLPPVTAPSASFLLQLFVIPAIIVLVIVVVWTLLNRLAHIGGGPEDYIDALRRNNPVRWQAAASLADDLRRTGSTLRHDEQFAAKLATLLSDELDKSEELEKSSSVESETEVRLRAYLASALGEFEVPAGLPVLIRAAGSQTAPGQLEARLAALEALAVLASHVPEGALADQQDDLLAVLATAADDEQTDVRYRAAFALGVIGGPPAQSVLRQLLLDRSSSHVRYNAAAALARHGDTRAAPMLIEMLDPEAVVLTASGDEPLSPGDRRQMLDSIQLSGLEAARQLLAAGADEQREELIAAITRLAEHPETGRPVAVKAKDVLARLGAARSPASAAP